MCHVMQENFNKKITSFTDLKAWQQAHRLTLAVYKSSKDFPPFEQFGLTNQMRRASVSIESNIAEGFGRQTKKEKNQFYYHAKGSLLELKSQLFLARDLDYMNKEVSEEIINSANFTHAILEGLIKTSFNR